MFCVPCHIVLGVTISYWCYHIPPDCDGTLLCPPGFIAPLGITTNVLGTHGTKLCRSFNGTVEKLAFARFVLWYVRRMLKEYFYTQCYKKEIVKQSRGNTLNKMKPLKLILTRTMFCIILTRQTMCIIRLCEVGVNCYWRDASGPGQHMERQGMEIAIWCEESDFKRRLEEDTRRFAPN